MNDNADKTTDINPVSSIVLSGQKLEVGFTDDGDVYIDIPGEAEVILMSRYEAQLFRASLNTAVKRGREKERSNFE